MTFYEFVLALSFWQWVGVLFVCGIAMATIVGTAEQLPKIFNRKTDA
jgi:D-alanyl-lipoteichoic acid acyltransferase DltB (MBOAT superfamily)